MGFDGGETRARLDRSIAGRREDIHSYPVFLLVAVRRLVERRCEVPQRARELRFARGGAVEANIKQKIALYTNRVSDTAMKTLRLVTLRFGDGKWPTMDNSQTSA